VVEVLEGNLALTPCAKHGDFVCPRMDNCVMKGGWSQIQQEVLKMLKNKNLKDLFNN